jgi:hypothetical protein
MRVTLSALKEAHSTWFSPENKRFFNDVEYRVLHGKTSHKPFLVRSTYAFTNMFGKEPKLHWRINPIEPDTLKIMPLIDDQFETLEEVKDWLENN